MLTAERKRSLRTRAHHLKPSVLIGQHGVTAAVLSEIERALFDHELIKIRFRGADRDERAVEVAGMCTTLAAELIASIGGTAVLYRERRDEHAPKRSAS